ncbi:potassium-transporting ATPase subunit KdpB [Streptomonospora sp. S1-112]|uniref:Potassium-transporting ATPase ATP-binding subunit n=1 Tax=Streptomonospora mangrovi TaxID=2883123 RepID=A0A9X3NQA9_9ACTN|nr:potassium-transporting ATPase subunit KdpB [Streptomonospora mangrovi]MDA0566311.1 potassium-transporting ATPase subunit KdpB [Streptomonospora mangrovi]
MRQALVGSVTKLDPRVQARNPVLFVVLVGSALCTVLFVRDLGSATAAENLFNGLVALFLWFTVLFANFAEALAEGRGKAQAATLRRARADTTARRRRPDGTVEEVAATALAVGDVCEVAAGEVIPGDGDVVEGVASVDESAITGESAPVIRESGGDRSAVTGGTRVLSDRIAVRITAPPGETFLDRMIALVEGAERRKTPNEVALNILLAGLTAVFLLAVVTLQPFAVYSGARQEVLVLVALLVCLIPTTIGALLSAIGIAGMDRLVRRNVLAMSGRAVEASGDVDTLLLDKTGTITLGNRRAAALVPMPGVDEADLARAAHRSSLADETPEGRSIVEFTRAGAPAPDSTEDEGDLEPVPFTAQTRMSGVDGARGRIRKGAVDAVAAWVRECGGTVPGDLADQAARIGAEGGTPLAVAEAGPAGDGGAPARVLGVVHLKDVVKPGMRERFERMRAMGIRTVMVTGDNPLTAKAIAEEAGVDDFLAEATPEDKLALIREHQRGGGLVAMTGDGTNDAPALAQADVGVAMNTGTQAAKEAGNMVDLDSDPTKLIEVVEIGKQLLITRGALTTFSIANDVAKYFAVIPAMFAGVLPPLDALNVMRLASPHSAILAAVVFNALVIVALIPLALRGVRFRPLSAAAMLRRNLLLYGVGGLVAPFVGIKLIDMAVTALGVF